jgi:hypothetical protein
MAFNCTPSQLRGEDPDDVRFVGSAIIKLKENNPMLGMLK